jgi:hypothetical protein
MRISSRLDLIMQLENINPVESHTAEARLQGTAYCTSQISPILKPHKDLGCNQWFRYKFRPGFPNDLFGFAFAIHRRNIKDIDPSSNRLLDCFNALLFGRLTPDHTDATTAKRNL